MLLTTVLDVERELDGLESLAAADLQNHRDVSESRQKDKRVT